MVRPPIITSENIIAKSLKIADWIFKSYIRQYSFFNFSLIAIIVETSKTKIYVQFDFTIIFDALSEYIYFFSKNVSFLKSTMQLVSEKKCNFTKRDYQCIYIYFEMSLVNSTHISIYNIHIIIF